MNISKKKVANLGSLDIEIPVLQIGKGKPIVSIITGLHGDETTGLFVIKELLKKVKSIRGSLRIIPSANPFAQATMLRTNIMDRQDINRVFNQEGSSLTIQTSKELSGIIKDSSLVIDIHSTKLETPLMGVLFLGNKELNKINEDLIRAFNPKQVWIINKEEIYKGTLSVKLIQQGIPNFGVEVNKEESFTNEDINECVAGIIRVLAKMKMIKPLNSKNKSFPFFEKKSFRCKESGLFIPLKKPFDKIKKDEVIGTITSMPEFKEIKIKSGSDGVLMQVSRKKFVLPGRLLFSIGKKIY